MRLFPIGSAYETALWRFYCILAVLLFFGAVVSIALLIRQKRRRWLWLAIPLLCLSYFSEQCCDMFISGSYSAAWSSRVVKSYITMPDWLLLSVFFALVVTEAFLLRHIHLYEKHRITTMSVKEAIDSLPSGVLCYVPGARTMLVNHVMRLFCRSATGHEFEDGEAFNRCLLKGELSKDCQRVYVGGEPVIVFPNGTAWKITEGEIPYEKYAVHTVLVTDITEAYQKTFELQAMQVKIEKLGERLQKVNREIVALTAEREVLNAKVKIHDELGSNLLAIKRFLVNGGTDEERAELVDTLRRSVSFLKNDSPSPVQDEYDLLISMAARLGLTIYVRGELPQNEPQKAIMAAAIHECLTNTLRHAHGNELHIEIAKDEETVTATFTNNGNPPETEIEEKGGLASLRELVRQAGGEMFIRSLPTFAVIIKLPQEDEYGV